MIDTNDDTSEALNESPSPPFTHSGKLSNSPRDIYRTREGGGEKNDKTFDKREKISRETKLTWTQNHQNPKTERSKRTKLPSP